MAPEETQQVPPETKPVKREDALRSGVSFGKILLTAALTALVSNIVTYRMWLTQQDRVQAWNSLPIVEVKIDALQDHKDLTIHNLGRIDISDVKVFLTVYELATRLIRWRQSCNVGWHRQFVESGSAVDVSENFGFWRS